MNRFAVALGAAFVSLSVAAPQIASAEKNDSVRAQHSTQPDRTPVSSHRYDRGDRYDRNDRHDRHDRYDRDGRHGRHDDHRNGHHPSRWGNHGPGHRDYGHRGHGGWGWRWGSRGHDQHRHGPGCGHQGYGRGGYGQRGHGHHGYGNHRGFYCKRCHYHASSLQIFYSHLWHNHHIPWYEAVSHLVWSPIKLVFVFD